MPALLQHHTSAKARATGGVLYSRGSSSSICAIRPRISRDRSSHLMHIVVKRLCALGLEMGWSGAAVDMVVVL